MDEFDCEAMNTSFLLKVCGEERNYARSAAIDCFDRLNSMEDLLSMYRYGSDIAMINSSVQGESVKVTGTTMDCLTAAFAVAAMGKGAVDVTMGEFFLKAKGVAPKNFVPKKGVFEIDPENFFVRKKSDGMIDLGAVGKGFAVDDIVDLLKDVWEIKNAFISFGGSSIAAFGKPDDADFWSVSIGDGDARIPVSGISVGASGSAVLGTHIVDARTGTVAESMPYRTWAFGESAAICDGLSTAFMLLSADEIADICTKFDIRAALQKTETSKIEYIGNWTDAPH